MKERVDEFNGWKYKYTAAGVEITNHEGQKIGRPVPLPDINIGKKRGGFDWFQIFMADPFSERNQRRDNPSMPDRKKLADAAADAHRDAITARDKQPKKPERAYVPSGPFWKL